jgi:hypothetical protein
MISTILKLLLLVTIGLPCMFISMGSYMLVDEVNKWIQEDNFWAYHALKWLIIIVSSPFKIGASFIQYTE